MGTKQQVDNSKIIERAKSLIMELSQKEYEDDIEKGPATSWIVDNIHDKYTGTKKVENEDFCVAVCKLEGLGILTSETLKEVIAANKSENSSVAVQELNQGLQNLMKLKKYGMDTPDNQKIVISAGLRATEASLGLWDKKKTELLRDARRYEGASLYGHSAVKSAAGDNVSKKLAQVSASLNRPVALSEKPVPPSPIAKGK